MTYRPRRRRATVNQYRLESGPDPQVSVEQVIRVHTDQWSVKMARHQRATVNQYHSESGPNLHVSGEQVIRVHTDQWSVRMARHQRAMTNLSLLGQSFSLCFMSMIIGH